MARKHIFTVWESDGNDRGVQGVYATNMKGLWQFGEKWMRKHAKGFPRKWQEWGDDQIGGWEQSSGEDSLYSIEFMPGTPGQPHTVYDWEKGGPYKGSVTGPD